MQAEARVEAPPAPPADITRLFEEHHRRVFHAAYRVTGSPSDAEDVLQTVFLKLLRRHPLPSLEPHPARYLERAAVNAALDLVRGRSSWTSLSEALPADAAGEPHRQAEERQLRERLRRALNRLSPRAAEMFALRYFEGHDLADIARLLGTSRGVVAVTLFRARARLKQELGS